jgi:hypothetical protein
MLPFFDSNCDKLSDALTHELQLKKTTIKYHPEILQRYSNIYRYDPKVALKIISESEEYIVSILFDLIHNCICVINKEDYDINYYCSKVIKLAKKLRMFVVVETLMYWLNENTIR